MGLPDYYKGDKADLIEMKKVERAKSALHKALADTDKFYVKERCATARGNTFEYRWYISHEDSDWTLPIGKYTEQHHKSGIGIYNPNSRGTYREILSFISWAAPLEVIEAMRSVDGVDLDEAHESVQRSRKARRKARRSYQRSLKSNR